MSDDRWVDVCALEELVPGLVHCVRIADDHDGRPREALVLRGSDGEPRAYLNRCQHVPIPLDAGSKQFLDREGRYLECATHGAIYRLDDGLCVGGPCRGDTLITLRFRSERGRVAVLGPVSDS